MHWGIDGTREVLNYKQQQQHSIAHTAQKFIQKSVRTLHWRRNPPKQKKKRFLTSKKTTSLMLITRQKTQKNLVSRATAPKKKMLTQNFMGIFFLLRHSLRAEALTHNFCMQSIPKNIYIHIKRGKKIIIMDQPRRKVTLAAKWERFGCDFFFSLQKSFDSLPIVCRGGISRR